MFACIVKRHNSCTEPVVNNGFSRGPREAAPRRFDLAKERNAKFAYISYDRLAAFSGSNVAHLTQQSPQPSSVADVMNLSRLIESCIKIIQA